MLLAYAMLDSTVSGCSGGGQVGVTLVYKGLFPNMSSRLHATPEEREVGRHGESRWAGYVL